MIKRLRWRFICINMTIVTVMLLVIFGLVLHFTGENLEEQSIRMMQRVTDSDRLQLGRPGDIPEGAQLPFFLVTITPYGDITATSGGFYDLSDEEAVWKVIQLARNTDADSGILKEHRLRFQKKTTLFGERIVFVDVSSELATMSALVKISIFIGILSLCLFFGISVLLARWAIRPVENAWNQQRQFVADASHELKTPLTVIITNAELLQSPIYSEAERGQFAGSILTMSHQMRGLVEGLLELARVDNGVAKMDFTEVDLSELISDSLLPFEPVYFEQGLILESQVETDIRVKGSERHLRQVLDILLDNAAKYSVAEAQVLVKLQRQGNHVLLSVANSGKPISREDLKNIFKRFYRVDKVRAMNHSYGLGLSIADSIVREHGGKIWAESNGGVNTFWVRLNIL